MILCFHLWTLAVRGEGKLSDSAWIVLELRAEQEHSREYKGRRLHFCSKMSSYLWKVKSFCSSFHQNMPPFHSAHGIVHSFVHGGGNRALLRRTEHCGAPAGGDISNLLSSFNKPQEQWLLHKHGAKDGVWFGETFKRCFGSCSFESVSRDLFVMIVRFLDKTTNLCHFPGHFPSSKAIRGPPMV